MFELCGHTSWAHDVLSYNVPFCLEICSDIRSSIVATVNILQDAGPADPFLDLRVSDQNIPSLPLSLGMSVVQKNGATHKWYATMASCKGVLIP